jgi:4-diphosphocytidyl-2-C-methyl-D-erythritol kinase
MSDWRERSAPAKLNLSLVVGPLRADRKHEVATVLEKLTLADRVAVRRATATSVSGFPGDTLVRDALDALARVAGGEPCFEAHIEKRTPVATGLGGGSSDAATALAIANDLLEAPLPPDELHGVAASIGADVPFFLESGPRLATGDGTTLSPLTLPRDYAVLLVLPAGAVKSSTADVYGAFDGRRGELGFEARREALLAALETVRIPADLAALPANDLASSTLAEDLRRLGAFRADVTGAGPVVYGLFADPEAAERARVVMAAAGAETWISAPG